MWLLLLVSAHSLLWNTKTSVFSTTDNNATTAIESLVLENGWFAWSVLPYIFANIGFWFTAIACDVYSTKIIGATSNEEIEYGNKLDRASRREMAGITIGRHLPKALFTTIVMQVPNAAVGKHFFQFLGSPPETMLPNFQIFLIHFACMQALFDFFLYCQHRASHVRKYLWHYHREHHEVLTTIGISATHVDIRDQALTALCVYLAAFIVQPHPVTYAISVAGILSELVIVHSGLDSPVLNFIGLRFLPGRASTRFHDYHHMYSNHMGGTNFGHLFWIWDYTFGTQAICNTSTISCSARNGLTNVER